MSSRDHEDEQDYEGREMPDVDSAARPHSLVMSLLFMFIGIGVVLLLLYINRGLLFEAAEEKKEPVTIKSTMPPLAALPESKPKPPPKPKPKPVVVKPRVVNTYVPPKPPPPKPAVVAAPQKKEETPQERKRRTEMFSFGGNRTQYVAQKEPRDSHLFQAADDGKIKIEDTRLEGARASVITDPSFWLTKGTFIDCALETAIDSTLKGMVKCRITNDIYSADGKVILVDRGSIVVGEYRTALKRGQNRLFVIWERIQTPQHVVVNIESPGTDALGRSGHGGFVDTHFWERFGAAIMFSIIGDLGDALVKSANDNSASISFGGTTGAARDTVSILVEDGLNIPPTINIHQGAHINIFLAQDLDFRGVYELSAR